jgi:ribose transport system permease protein
MPDHGRVVRPGLPGLTSGAPGGLSDSASLRRSIPAGTRARLRALVPLGVLVLLCLTISAVAPAFLSLGNLVRVLIGAAIPMTLACGMTFVILLGSIDLSVEGVVAIAAVVLSLLVANGVNANDYGLAAVPLAVLAGALAGLVNGVIHVRLRIPSLIASLGIGFAGIGLATLILGGSAVPVTDPLILGMAFHRLLGIPVIVWIAVAAVAIAWFVQDYTRLGRWTYALGGGEDICTLSGVPIGRVRIGVFTLAGAFYGLGGALSVAQFGEGQALIGQGFLFAVITAVVVGGTSLSGGVGGVLNSVVGVLVVTVLGNGMVLMGVPPELQEGVQGLLILIAVGLSLDRARARIVK